MSSVNDINCHGAANPNYFRHMCLQGGSQYIPSSIRSDLHNSIDCGWIKKNIVHKHVHIRVDSNVEYSS